MNKKYIKIIKLNVLLCILMLSFPALSQSPIQNQRTLQQADVQAQRELDQANRLALQQKMRTYIADINKDLRGTNKNITPPINVDDTTDISRHNVIHSDQQQPKPIYAFSNVDNLNMRSQANTKSQIIAKVGFAETVQLIGKTSDNETINGVSAPWLLVRKSNGNEGWVFGGYLQENAPNKRRTFEELEDKQPFATKLDIPVEGRLSSNFGTRVDPKTKKSNSFHSGIDFAAPQGTPVYAAESGTIIRAEFNRNGYGNLIVIQHSENLTTYYGHLHKISVKVGEKVNRRQLIGEVGSTGNSTGPHLHFEVRRGGVALNPNEFIR